MKTVLHQLGRYKRDTLLCIGLTNFEVIMEILLPSITSIIIDQGLEASNLPVVYRYGPVDKSAIGYSMELRPMALRVLRRLTPGCFRVVRSFTIRFRFNAVAERRQCS